MSDVIDMAGAAAALFQDAGMSAHRQRQAAELAKPLNRSGLCADCDEPIEAGRIKANPRAERCVSCQCDHERRTGIY